MSSEPMARWRVAMTIALLNDLQRANALSGITKVAQQSPLMQIASVAGSYAQLTTKGAALATNVTSAAADEKVYLASVGALGSSRIAFDRELDTFKTLVENNATSAADITAMGFLILTLNKASRTQPDPPGALVVRLGKVHGKAFVTVQGSGYLGGFVAQMALDPIGPTTTWSEMPGRGKQRKLSGYASGTKIWVRFAAVRFGLQSDWCVPVLVTIP